MKFLTIPAHEALRPFIRNYWHLRSMATGDGIQRITNQDETRPYLCRRN